MTKTRSPPLGSWRLLFAPNFRPCFKQWQSVPGSERSGTLIIEPQLASLRIVSVGARFWIGGFAGDSSIDMDLTFTEQSNGQQIARPRITRSADAMTGGWSVGQSDQNLLDYIASIAYHYMTDNY